MPGERMIEAEVIAAGLTEAQRNMVLTDQETLHRAWKGRWSAYGDPLLAESLFRLGLIAENSTFPFPTDLGMAVREALAHPSPEQSSPAVSEGVGNGAD